MSFNFGATSTGNKPLLGTSTSTPAGSSLFGGFGGTATTSATTGFNFSTNTNASSGGGLAGSTGFGTGFGTGASGFGSTLGAGLGSTGTGGFGTGLGLANTQQQQQQQQANQQQALANNLANMATAVSLPVLFGDERDAILAKWNQLQAFWGTGKGYFSQQAHPIEFSPDNPFCRFKAVGFSCIPKNKNKDGLVGLVFDKKENEIKSRQQQIVDALHKVLGSKPQVSVCVDSVRPLPDNKTEMVIFIQERSQTGVAKRYSAYEVYNHLNQANIQQQLKANLSVSSLLPKTGLTNEQLKNYLEHPPTGIDPLIWRQAKLDNPDCEKLLPVPMIGFAELHRRLKHQEQQTKLHHSRIEVINEDISAIQRNHSDMLAKIEQYRRKQLELGHRLLQVLVRQEVHRKQGYAVQADEEQLRVQLEAIQAELNAPTQFKGRLNEMMSQLRMQNQLGGGRPEATYQMDDGVQAEVRQHLLQQQEGLSHLIAVIHDNLDDLSLIEHGYTSASQHPATAIAPTGASTATNLYKR